jgi:catechol 2,3-dioxygenase-like lactoylglutathione lyase family enzyme
MMAVAKTGWWGVVLEAPDARELAQFYAQLLGWPIVDDEPDWVTILQPNTTSSIAFNSSPEYLPPVWPPAQGEQQMMMHLDVGVSDVAAAVADAVALGAREAEFQPQENVRVMLDPAGHPFCLYLDQ